MFAQIVTTMRIRIPLVLILTLMQFSADGGEPPVHLNKTLGNLKFVERTDYEQKELGYSLRYQTKDLLKADVYVYDLGIRNLPDGIASPEIRKEMENAKGVLRELEKMGKYKNVKELGNGERKFENLNTRFLWTRFSYEQSAGEGVAFTGARISETFLLAHRGRFLKVRITAKHADWVKHEPQIDQFIREIAQQLEKGEPGGATNVSQPIRSETNRTSSAPGSRR